MTLPGPTRSADSLVVGEKHPPLEKSFTAIDLVAYGAATWDWHRLHYDVEYARSLKLPNVIVDGQAFGGLFARAALDWLGPQAFLAKMSLRMKAMVFAGDSVRIEGEVTEVRREAGYSIVAIAQRMTCRDKTAAEATIEVRLPG